MPDTPRDGWRSGPREPALTLLCARLRVLRLATGGGRGARGFAAVSRTLRAENSCASLLRTRSRACRRVTGKKEPTRWRVFFGARSPAPPRHQPSRRRGEGRLPRGSAPLMPSLWSACSTCQRTRSPPSRSRRWSSRHPPHRRQIALAALLDGRRLVGAVRWVTGELVGGVAELHGSSI